MDDTGESTLRPRRRGRRAILLIAALLLGSVGYQVFKPAPPVIEAVTPDGKFIIRFMAAGVGNLDYRPDGAMYVLFHKYAKDFLPVVLFRKLPAPTNSYHPGPPTRTGAEPLLMLFTIRPVDPATKERSHVLSESVLRFDEQTGFELESPQTHRFVSGPGEVIATNTFPRRDNLITVRLVDPKTANSFMTITFPNPAPVTQGKAWTPQPMPLERSSPELTCTLKGFTPAEPHRAARPIVEIKPLAAAWSQYHVETLLEDATGNWGNALSPFESVWRVKTTVQRTVDAEFTADEAWRSPAFEIPDEKTRVSNLNLAGTVGSTTFKLAAVKGPGPGTINLREGQWQFSIGGSQDPIQRPHPKGSTYYNVPSYATKNPFLVLEFDKLETSDELLVRVRDQQNEVIGNVVRPLTRFSDGGAQAVVQFESPGGNREVRAEVIISRPQTFLFDVEPPAELRARYAKPAQQ